MRTDYKCAQPGNKYFSVKANLPFRELLYWHTLPLYPAPEDIFNSNKASDTVITTVTMSRNVVEQLRILVAR